MSIIDLKNKWGKEIPSVVLLEKIAFKDFLKNFQESIIKLEDENNIISQYALETENGCPFMLNDLLQSVNDTMETDYCTVLDALNKTYDLLMNYKDEMERIDRDSVSAFRVQRTEVVDQIK